jgi:hypothetical protein
VTRVIRILEVLSEDELVRISNTRAAQPARDVITPEQLRNIKGR